MKLLIASNNAGKLAEFRGMLAPYFDSVLCPRDLGISLDPEETGTTFAQNARIKCLAFRAAAPEYAVLSDDSGLSVDALGGEPGVYSARYAGDHGDNDANIDKLLAKLEGVSDRRAHFTSALVLITTNNVEYVAEGHVYGRILPARDGTGGFGYDPIFLSDDLGASFGRVSEEEKNTVSHRARALASLVTQLRRDGIVR